MRYVAEDSTIGFKFPTRDGTGAMTTLSGTPSLAAYAAGSVTQITAGITLTVDYDSKTGLNNVVIDLSADAGYVADTEFTVVIEAGTVDGVSVVGETVYEFFIVAAGATEDAITRNMLALPAIASGSAGGLRDVARVAGTAQTAGDVVAKQNTAQADLDLLTGTDGATLATSQPNYAPAKAGNQMDLVNAPNATALAAIGAKVEAMILDEGDATALLAAIAAKVEEFLINEGDSTATLAAIAAAVTTAIGDGSALTEAGGTGDHLTTLTGQLTGISDTLGSKANQSTLLALSANLLATVVYNGTIGPTGNDTTHLHLAGLAWGDDDPAGMLILVKDVSAGIGVSRWITGWANTGDLVELHSALPFTPQAGVDTFSVLPTRRPVTDTDLEDGGRLDNILDELTDQGDTNEAAIGNLNNITAAQVWAAATRTLTANPGLDATGVRNALGLSAANLDTQLATLLTLLSPASGTIGATGNDSTHLHLSGIAWGDDAPNDMLVLFKDVSTGLFHSCWISDWDAAGDLATITPALPTPEPSVDLYWVLPSRRDVSATVGDITVENVTVESLNETALDQISERVIEDHGTGSYVGPAGQMQGSSMPTIQSVKFLYGDLSDKTIEVVDSNGDAVTLPDPDVEVQTLVIETYDHQDVYVRATDDASDPIEVDPDAGTITLSPTSALVFLEHGTQLTMSLRGANNREIARGAGYIAYSALDDSEEP